MERKTFLRYSGLLGLAAIIPPSLYLISPSMKKQAISSIHKELHYLTLDPAGVEQYVDDYFNDPDFSLSSKLRWKVLYYMRYDTKKSNQLFALVKFYLLSSDFFVNKMDKRKVVQYVGLYNPYKTKFPNPFSYVLHQ